MAYAKLVFPSGTFALKKLKEIARFATGQITTTADLESADQSLSEIVISEAPGWSLESQTFEASGTATANTYKLRASCVNSLKTKYIMLKTFGARQLSPANSGTAFNTIPTSTSTTAYFFLIQSPNSSYTSTLTTYWPYAFSDGNTGSSAGSAVFPGTSLVASTIYVFSTARKLIVFSPETSGRSDYSAILEFPETVSTLEHSNIPCININARYLSANTPSVLSHTGNTTLAASGAPSSFYYDISFVDWYNPVLNTRKNLGIEEWGTNNVEFFSTPSLNITAEGSPAYPLLPMTDIRVLYGEGVHDYSYLTNMYITYREASYIGQGDTINVSGVDYVILQVGDATSNYRALAIKKG
jgi:hypothetical protein